MPIHLRKMQDCIQDYCLLLQWYTVPQVQNYFTPPITTLEETIQKYRPRILGEHPAIPYIIETDGIPVGYLQIFPLTGKEITRYSAQNYQTPYGVDLSEIQHIYIKVSVGSAQRMQEPFKNGLWRRCALLRPACG